MLRYSRSAPTKPCVTAAILSWSTRSQWHVARVYLQYLRACPVVRHFDLDFPVKSAGRLSAGSIAFGLLVAPITMTFPLATRPSMNESSCETTLLSTSPETSSLFGAIESISSMKMIDGAFSFASLNISRSLAFAVELTYDLWAGYRIKVGVGFIGDCLGKQGLASSRRTVEEDAFWRFNADPLKYFRMP